MSEAVLPSSASQTPRRAPARARRNRLSSLEALEGGFALFRSTFGQEAWRYYAGAIPLVACFIPMWVVNGQVRTSAGALFLESTLLAACYCLRVRMIGSYMQRVRERAFGTPMVKSAGVVPRAAGLGRLIAWKIMLSAGALTTLPSLAGGSWFYSACQFASLEAQEDGTEKRSFTVCLALASQWFGAGLLLFLMLFPIWAAVWLNGLILAIIFPQLLHSIFGVNTLLSTRMGIYALTESSAFWLSLFAGAWVALDPIVKCSFIIVYQYLRARREGDDLRGLLASLPRHQEKKAQMIASTATASRVATSTLVAVAIAASVCWTANATAAQITPTQSTIDARDDSARDARVQRLRQALDQESKRAIYRWHDADHPSPPTWIDKLLIKMEQKLKEAWDKLWNFLGKLWPRDLSLSPGLPNAGGWRLRDVRFWVAVIGILAVSAVGVLFWLRQRREAASLSIPLAIAPILDLSDVAAASERSEDEWFALASRLEGEGELRLALRAAYFALLAGLSQREWLTIRRDRTNREYLSEFTRRWCRRPQAAIEARAEVPEKLRGSLRQFDRVWYGFHAVTPEAVTLYRRDQQEFLNHV